MDVMFTWDGDRGVATIEYQGAVIDSDAAYEEWTAKLKVGFEEMKRRAGGKYRLVVDIDQLSIKAPFQKKYGQELAVWVAENFATAIARYGSRSDTRTVVATQAMKRAIEHPGNKDVQGRAYAANMFDNREAAVAFVTAHPG